jgi:hypothetical protein
MQLKDALMNRRDAMATARQSRNQMEKDRIMAGQNHIRRYHAASPFMVLPARILSLLRMILSVSCVWTRNPRSLRAIAICAVQRAKASTKVGRD